jgi:2-polyprenyl-3-methyl-5-hydroxy-6-metoxy-1,4-benzoquinol methylase
MFGRHERLVAELWRAGFIDLDDFFRLVGKWVPQPRAILEIGCGEGAGTERLAAAYPDASILAIDIAENLGRLYRGRDQGVTFRRVPITEMASTHAGKFDLIIMCDVLHHIPEDLRPEIIAAARTLLAPGGSFICKDWARTATPIHWLCFSSDRWLTGDRVNFLKPDEARRLMADVFGREAVRSSGWIKPWRNNYAFLVQP